MLGGNMAEYVIESRTMNNVFLTSLPFKDLQGEIMLSKPSAMRFTVPWSAVDFSTDEMEEGRTEIQIYRNGVKIYTGPVWDIDISTNENTFKVTSEDISSYFDLRQLESAVKYSMTYGDMAWNLINSTQNLPNGNLYITRGSTTGAGSPAGTVTFKNAEYLSDQINSVADGTFGFDWLITPERVFNQYYPRISSRANVALSFPGNIKSYSVNRQGKYLRNKIRTVGPNGTLSSWAVDNTSLAKYGVRHYSESQTSLTSANALNAFNGQMLAQRRYTKVVSNIVIRSDLVNPFEGDITLGQVTKVSIEDKFNKIDTDMRLVGFQLTVGKQGNETFNLYFNDLREV